MRLGRGWNLISPLVIEHLHPDLLACCCGWEKDAAGDPLGNSLLISHEKYGKLGGLLWVQLDSARPPMCQHQLGGDNNYQLVPACTEMIWSELIDKIAVPAGDSAVHEEIQQ